VYDFIKVCGEFLVFPKWLFLETCVQDLREIMDFRLPACSGLTRGVGLM
jgi:hypothetical protein